MRLTGSEPSMSPRHDRFAASTGIERLRATLVTSSVSSDGAAPSTAITSAPRFGGALLRKTAYVGFI
jgi:hypothetical protein